MSRFLAVLEYDGSGFCGSQVQPGQRSVQGEVEAAVERLNGHPTPVILAGRTDSGVHASGQVGAIDLERDMTGGKLADALNGLLARDVSVREAVPVPATFHPRFWAEGRRYAYRVLMREQRDACRERYVWHVVWRLDVGAMGAAAASLIGRHDFGAFGRPPQGDNTWRTVRRLDVEKRGDEVLFTIEADAFLRHMARTVVGTLVDVGRGRLSVGDVAGLRDRRGGPGVGAAAPAKGLTLTAVAYERERLGHGAGDGETTGRLPEAGGRLLEVTSRCPYWWSCEPLAGAG